MKKWILLLFAVFILFSGCKREPELYLYDAADVSFELPIIDLSLEMYWDYELSYGVTYDWEAEWHYGWDEIDRELFGEIGYVQPQAFNLRRYFTEAPNAAHTSVLSDYIRGTTFQESFSWGFWDLLIWNDITTIDGIRSILFDETTTLDYVKAYTNESMQPSRYHAPRYTHSFYAPEPLFAAYSQAVEINPNLSGFVYDDVRNVYVMKLNMALEPLTFIYLTQVILHNNKGRIVEADGSANLSGMAQSVVLNTGRAGDEAITVNYNVRMKKDCQKDHETVDIVGGRLMTFGMCNTRANALSRAEDLDDRQRHYMDVTLQFNNGMDSTFIFDVTQQVRNRYKGGVITVELDMDTIPIPSRSGGSAFDAVVRETEDGGTYEIEM